MRNVPKIKVNQRVNFEDLKKVYPDSWVLLKNIHKKRNSPIIEDGIFLYKNKNQDKAFKKISDFEKNGAIQDGDVLAVEYTGGKLDELEYIFVL
jgi:hypothetical protein